MAKTMPKDQRKRLQIEETPRKSAEAKLLKIADKICNVYDVGHRPPEEWSPMRRQAYVAWTARVVDGCRGVSAELYASAD